MNYFIFIYIAFLFLIALLSTRVMKLIKLPNVTGYLLTGIVMGPYVLGLFFNNFDFLNANSGIIHTFCSQITWISDVALGFIAFSIGTSFKFSSLKKVGKQVIVITILESLFASVLVFLGLLILHFIFPSYITWTLTLTLAAIAAATAPAATLLVIKQYKADGPVVRTLLPVVALDDASALILYAILFQIAKTLATGNGSFDLYLMLLKPLIEIVLSLLIGAIIGIFITLLSKIFLSRNNRLILIIFSIFLSLGIVYLFKQNYMGEFELSSLLITMMAGAIFINFSKDSLKTFDLLDRFTNPIYMIFFVISGTQLDLTIFGSNLILYTLLIALIYIIFRVLGKYLGAYTGATITKTDNNIKKYLGLALIPQAGVAIGLSTQAGSTLTDLGLSQDSQIIVACILLTCLIFELFGPFVTKTALKKAGEIKE